jgi:hypothetical protein
LVVSQVSQFFGLRPAKLLFLQGSCSETEVSEQLHYVLAACDGFVAQTSKPLGLQDYRTGVVLAWEWQGHDLAQTQSEPV